MTTEKKIKAAGYVRVSSKEQVDGESLSTQRESIKNFCKSNGYKLTEIYADEGISGGTVKDRHALLKCLYDGQNGKFDTLVVHRLSRFGRNARELLNNHEELSNAGIDLRSISEGIDFGSKYGKAMLGMFSVMAELENDIRTEQFLENRISRAQKGIPTAGKLPFGRTFNRESGKWELDEKIAGLIRWAADEYLKGASLLDITDILKSRHDLNITYPHLVRVLKGKCGDSWTVQFENEKLIEYKIPRILDDNTIQRIIDRLSHNRVETRPDVKKYVLSGFIRCEKCGCTLSGQTQVNRHGKTFHYYRHPTGRQIKCKAFSSVPVEQIENAVFQTIFENIWDVPSFDKAIANSLPDEQMINNLESGIKTTEKELRKINKELDKLVDLAMSGTLEKSTIRQREQKLIQNKEKVSEELDNLQSQLNGMPDINVVKQEAEDIRQQLLDQYSGQERLHEMTFDDKKTLLHWLFDGKDKEGTKYGIYVMKEKRIRGKLDYFLYGRITGLRTVKGNNIDWHEDDEENGRGNSEEKLYKISNGTFNNDHGLP